jgi:hypothetical protein
VLARINDVNMPLRRFNTPGSPSCGSDSDGSVTAVLSAIEGAANNERTVVPRRHVGAVSIEIRSRGRSGSVNVV